MSTFELLQQLFATEDMNKEMKLESTTAKQLEQIESLQRSIDNEKNKIDVSKLKAETSI